MSNKLQAIISACVVIIVLGGLTAWAVYTNIHQAKPVDQALQASEQRNALLQAQAAKDTDTITNNNSQLTALNTQKATLCAQIKAAKLTQPLCQ